MHCPHLDGPEQPLEEADVPSVGNGGGSQGKVVHVGEHQAPRDPEVQGYHINEEKKRRDGRALGGPNVDRGRDAWSALEEQGAAEFSQKRRDPGDQRGGDTALPDDACQCGVVDVGESSFDVQKEDTFKRGLCRVFTSFMRVRQASYVLSPQREPDWLG